MNSKNKKTSVPFATLASEAHFLHLYCQSDKEILVKAGLDWNIVESIPSLYLKSTDLYARYTAERIFLSDIRRKEKRLFRAASRVRSRIAERIRDVIKLSGTEKKLQSFHRRVTYPQIIMDLYILSDLCYRFENLLVQTGFNMSRAAALKKLSRRREEGMLRIVQKELFIEELKGQYRKAYHELYAVSQAIRDAAFRAYPKGSRGRKGYQSSYRNRLLENEKLRRRSKRPPQSPAG